MAALVPHYVTQAGTDTYANSTNPATPCSLNTALGGAAAGDIVWIKYSSTPYSQAGVTVPNATATNSLVFAGYHTTIGDCDNLGRDADGTLITAVSGGVIMPDITITGIVVTGAFVVLK